MAAATIGTVTLTMPDGRNAQARLTTRARWGFKGDYLVASVLRNYAALIDLGDHSPSDGPFGPRQLKQLADLAEGELALADLPGPPDDTVF